MLRVRLRSTPCMVVGHALTSIRSAHQPHPQPLPGDEQTNTHPTHTIPTHTTRQNIHTTHRNPQQGTRLSLYLNPSSRPSSVCRFTTSSTLRSSSSSSAGASASSLKSFIKNPSNTLEHRQSSCVTLHLYHSSHLTSFESDSTLRLMCMNPLLSRMETLVLVQLWRRSLEKGHLRQDIRIHVDVLKFLTQRQEWKLVVQSYEVLKKHANIDVAKVCRKHIINLEKQQQPQPTPTRSQGGQQQQPSQNSQHEHLLAMKDPALIVECMKQFPSIHTSARVLHLNREIFHLASTAELHLNLSDSAIHILTNEMPRAMKLIDFMPNGPSWSYDPIDSIDLKSESSDSQSTSPPLTANDLRPTVATHLRIARAAFQQGRYELARDTYLRAWEEAERDWLEKEKKLRTYLADGKMALIDEIRKSPPLPLSSMDSNLYLAVHHLFSGYCRTLPEGSPLVDSIDEDTSLTKRSASTDSHDHASDDDHRHLVGVHSSNPSMSSPMRPIREDSDLFWDIQRIRQDWKRIEDLPEMIHINRGDLFRIVWSISALATIKEAQLKAAKAKNKVNPNEKEAATVASTDSAHHPKASSSSSSSPRRPSFASEMGTFDPPSQRILLWILQYARNPVWVGSWLMGPGPYSLYDTSLLHDANMELVPKAQMTSPSSPSSSASPSEWTVPIPKESPQTILDQSPSSTLELIALYLNKHHAFNILVTLYRESLLPAYEDAHQSLAQRLLSDGLVELVDLTIGSRPHYLRSRHMLRYKRRQSSSSSSRSSSGEMDMYFSVVTIPPAETPTLLPLSNLTQNTIMTAFSKLALQGRHHAEFVEFLQLRAEINTFYVNVTPDPGTIFEFHRRTGLKCDALIKVLNGLQPQGWQLTSNIVNQVFKRILLPYLHLVEKKKRQAAAAAMPSEQLPPPTFYLIGQSQAIFTLLMRRCFYSRRYSLLIGVYERDHLIRYTPSLPLTPSETLYLIQAYTWMGNLSPALELLRHMNMEMLKSSQRLCIHAFMCHFLETHVMKSIKQFEQKQQQQQQTSTTTIVPTMTQQQQPPPQQVRSGATSSSPSSSLPLPHLLPPPNMSSMGSPILTPNGEPIYHTVSQFHCVTTHHRPTTALDQITESDWEIRKVEAWKSQMMDLLHERHGIRVEQQQHQQKSQPKRRHHHLHGWVSPPKVLKAGLNLFDDIEFLQAPNMFQKVSSQAMFESGTPSGPIVSSNSSASPSSTLGYLPHKDRPQSSCFSFGMGSPAFSSYATKTSNLTMVEKELDPLINYQIAQIQTLLEMVRGQKQQRRAGCGAEM